MDERENTVEAREKSMRLQLDGCSAAVTAAEASAGLVEAQRELAGRGGGVGLGFGYVKNLGSPGGIDGIELEYAITDGRRVANVHVLISGTQLASPGCDDPQKWALGELYRLAGLIAHDDDRYATLLRHHPLDLG